MFKCPRCSQTFNSYNSLSKHTNAKYKLSGESLYREYHNIAEVITCKCGCGTPTKWRIDRGYGEYVNGHNSKGKNNIMFGKTHTKQARANISSKRKARFADGSLTVWCEGLTKETDERLRVMGENTSNNVERSAKISEALSGVPKSKEHARKSRIGIKKAWENEELRERQRINILNRFLSKKKNSPSRLEMMFEKMLIESRIAYETQFNLAHRLYDFKIKNTNILVEVDGDFYHTNPNKYASPICKTQKNVMKNDTKKNEIARVSGYKLLRFWETDIKNNPQQVITQLLAEINKSPL